MHRDEKNDANASVSKEGIVTAASRSDPMHCARIRAGSRLCV
jgi:hypothetical protein